MLQIHIAKILLINHFFSRTCLGKSFNSAREAKLYDAISEFFDNKKSSNEIEFLVDFINSYNSK